MLRLTWICAHWIRYLCQWRRFAQVFLFACLFVLSLRGTKRSAPLEKKYLWTGWKALAIPHAAQLLHESDSEQLEVCALTQHSSIGLGHFSVLCSFASFSRTDLSQLIKYSGYKLNDFFHLCHLMDLSCKRTLWVTESWPAVNYYLT